MMTNNLYNDTFFKFRIGADFQKSFGYQLGAYLSINSIIDFGCGLGRYLEGFKDVGVSIKGFDYAFQFSKKYTAKSILPFIEFGDVTQPIDVAPADCSMSIEVAEHIDPRGSQQFVQNLCLHSLKYILLTAAPPGQTGDGHINCQPQSYWISLIENFGFIFLKKETDQLKELSRPVKNMRWWITKNLMFFEKST